jgi:hypothetical protein
MSIIPTEYECPITYEIMTDPVVGSDGHTYERAAILECLTRDGRSPITRAPMLASSLRPNYALKSQIERYLATKPTTAVLAPKPFVSHPVTLVASPHNLQTVHITVTAPTAGVRQPIVMLIALDNSGSMAENASADTNETGGMAFTRMDLCKHTIRTVAAMLNDDDMLGLVSFSTTARTVLKPMFMTAEGKARLETALATVKPDSQTNIWAGLESIHRMAQAFPDSHVVAALLTDGLPNINPPRGIVDTYKTLPKKYTMSTFGFGYNLDSKVLYDIATEGKGSFGFIPDYSMVATVFINWAATALATASLNQPITLTYADGATATVPSNSIQFGQSRRILHKTSKPVVRVTLGSQVVDMSEPRPSLYLTARSDVMDAIGVCIATNGATSLFRLAYDMYNTGDDAELKELLRDIKPSGEDEGQVSMAPRYYEKWGKHYLRAYLKAHELEQCMNFKDPGLQTYGGDLFHAIQAEGEAAFSALPALEPTGAAPSQSYGAATAAATAAAVVAAPSMAQMFYNSSGGCFHGDSQVRMADGTRKSMSQLRRGNMVWTPAGDATVRALVICHTSQLTQSICTLGALRITPWHPVLVDGVWTFPCDLVPATNVALTTVYNVLLDSGHVLDVENILCVTLAHMMTGPVIEHDFFGTQKVVRNLESASGWEDGLPTYYDLRAFRNPLTGQIEEWVDGIMY